MRPTLPTGTILQNRYRILSILGQGGFGRTYLAEDQGRFNEPCALKELTPAQGDEYALDKSKQLFQREAQILYQIQHPQIPQFRATFEQDQRFFLVQDYVEGQTYRALLDQRRAQGVAFSEIEVLQLLRQLLPVLAHIHSKGIVHRDIAPDNVILRRQDNKPVLIDFGVVKELATRFQTMAAGMVQPTTVGKPGYAPSEQMQTGKAYPSSDLYSLAVTAVVLLTGREPQELFDDGTMTWYWQRWVMVSPGFAQVLNQMLSYRPGDRYQSVSEVVQALQMLPASVGTESYQQNVSAGLPGPNPQAVSGSSPPVSQIPPTQVSQMQTVAIGRRSDIGSEPVRRSPRDNPAEIEPPRTSIWDDPLAFIGAGLGMVVLTGLGSWFVMRAILNNPTPPSPNISASISPSPTASLSPTIAPSPLPASGASKPPEPANETKRLDNLAPGKPVSQQGTLRADETVTYVVTGKENETLEAFLSGEGVLMTIYGTNNQPVDNRAERVSFWQGTFPYTGEYFLVLKPVKGVDKGQYELNLNLRSPEPIPPSPNPQSPNPESPSAQPPSPQPPSPQPSSPPPTSPEPPRVEDIPVDFPAGDSKQSFSDRIKRNVSTSYLVAAPKGAVLTAQIWGGATLKVYDPSGRIVSANGATYLQAIVTYDGDYKPGTYRIEVAGQKGADYTLDIGLVDRERSPSP